MEHGKNVRSPSLVGGTSYVMKTWLKVHTYEEVKFIGFLSGTVEYKSPNKQLKDMLTTDFYRFIGADKSEFRGKMLDNCLVHATSEQRITFFQLAGVTTEAPVKAPKTAKKTPAPATVQAEPEVEAPEAVETVLDETPVHAADEPTEEPTAEIEPEADPVDEAVDAPVDTDSDAAAQAKRDRKNAQKRESRARLKAAKVVVEEAVAA